MLLVPVPRRCFLITHIARCEWYQSVTTIIRLVPSSLETLAISAPSLQVLVVLRTLIDALGTPQSWASLTESSESLNGPKLNSGWAPVIQSSGA